VHEVVPLAELEAAGERVVAHVLENGPEAIAETKSQVLRSAFSDLDDAAFARLVESHAAKRRSAEAAEGLKSFAEKRPASWTPKKP
jgi:methylglutaconyl-CoA hydratase